MPGGIFDSGALREAIGALEAKTAAPEFWGHREEAEKTLSELKKLHDRLDPWAELRTRFNDVKELYELAADESEESLGTDIAASLDSIGKEFERLRVLELLGDDYDDSDTFLTIHSGAGGTEACDWVNMLYRMYGRWAERRGFQTEILDLLEAEGGIKSVTMKVGGPYAYGHLKAETGIHRLVRISPFDSSSRRHTSFASVHASPVIDDDIEVDIQPDDLRIDTYRSQGAGGQHVNKTDSAVRITHIPTGIVVQCQNERSQHKNKATAMKVLRSRLFERLEQQREEELEKAAQEKKDISWGNQIRSYVFHPYSMVKDHRTKQETGNTQAVMDGSIDEFIEAYLKFR
jgi:peptide chain release factor 2